MSIAGVSYRPDGIGFTLLKVRTDLEHTPPHIAPLIRVERKHLADILAYVTHLEDEIEDVRREMDETKNEEG